ncbi:MAG: MFS transporter [Burkholderiales bacterium]|nr:MFS transporter [Burkholderiales bacterium]
MSETRWPAALGAVALGVIAAFTIGKLPPAIPVLRAEFGLTLAQSGWLVSMFNTLGLVASIFLGLLVARAGAMRLCLAALALIVAGGLAGVLAHGPLLLLAGRFLEGMGFLLVVVAAPALIIAATADRDRKTLFSFWGGYMPAGTAIGMLAAPPLIALAGWRALWLAVAGAALVALVLLSRNRAAYRIEPPASDTLDWRGAAAPLRRAGPWWIALAFACYVFNYYAIMVWLPTYLIGERGVGLTAAALLTALMVAANFPGNLVGGMLMQRGVARGSNVIAAGLITLVTCAAAFAESLPDLLRYAACVAFSFGVGVLPGSVMSASQTHARTPAQVGTVQGMIIQGSNIGQFVSPLVVAAAVAQAGGTLDWQRMLGLLVVSAGLIIICGVMIRRVERVD